VGPGSRTGDNLTKPMVAPTDEYVERAHERVGRTLNGKWHLDHLLGAGGMAAVYRGTHRNGNRAAIKVLYPELAHEVSLRRRFLREGYVANAVGHEGAVTVLDDGVSEDGELYLVMELLRGMTIQTRWEKVGRKFSTKEALSVAHSVLDILAAAHKKGILHRDVKPENVFLTQDKRIKLLDFGLARLREDAKPPRVVSADDSRSETPDHTSNGQLIGTVSFMAPEQALARADQVDQRTDLWGVGAMTFTLLAGRTVHEARTPHEHLVIAATQPAPPLAATLAGVPLIVCQVIDKALAFQKDDRWPDALTMQRAVAEAYTESERAKKG
jgi:eukaryotic-like serine/threonine-protein kinase